VRALAQSAFVDEDDGAALFVGFFLISGQRSCFQRRIFSSSRSKARPTGRWQLQPSCRRMRQACEEWYFTPHSCSIRCATRPEVHSLVSYPRASGPRFNPRCPHSALLQLPLPAADRLPVHSHLASHFGGTNSLTQQLCAQQSPFFQLLKISPYSYRVSHDRKSSIKPSDCHYIIQYLIGGGMTLRDLRDRKGQELIDGVLEVVDRLKPLHLSIVGGDPLVRHRELELMIPLLLDRGIYVQVVTSAFRPLAPGWATLAQLKVVVSIDGLQPEHDVRRAPATYDRILENITGQKITIHCTVTGQMMKRPGYLKEFLEY